jgi:DNA repair exonuclease SbcCD ATPase subunit
MEDLLQHLVESDLLTEETKKELTEAVEKQIAEATEAAVAVAITEAKAEVEAQVRVELQEQYQADKESLVEALDTKAEEYLKEELEELKDDISRFRDLEVEYAEKLEEAREELSQVLKGDIEELVETLDSFLDMRLAEEVTELKEDIDQVKRLQFGAELFEAFEAMFSKKFVDEHGLEDSLTESKEQLEEVSKKLEESSSELAKIQREKKLDEVLSSLHGRSREVMEAVLANHPTEKLEEAYEHYISKVLHENATDESDDVESEKETSDDEVLAEGEEGATDDAEKDAAKDELEEGTVVATGDSEKLIEESDEDDIPTEVKETLARLKKLGGIQ